MRFIIVQDDTIHQILRKEPIYIPEGMEVISYEGNEPDCDLYVKNRTVYAKEHKTVPPQVIPISVEKYQKENIQKIEVQIEKARSRFSSQYIGQNEVYYEKEQEALDYVASDCLHPLELYPLLLVDAELENRSGAEVARSILEKRKQWISFAAKSEKLRRQALFQIKNCNNNQDIDIITINTLKELNNIS